MMSTDQIRILGSKLFGDQNADLRNDLMAAGASHGYDNELNTVVWRMSRQVYDRFKDLLPEGCRVGMAEEKPVEPVTPALPPPTTPMPQPEQVPQPAPDKKPLTPEQALVPTEGGTTPPNLIEGSSKQIPMVNDVVLVVQSVSVTGAVSYYVTGKDTQKTEEADGTEVAKRTKTSVRVVRNPKEKKAADLLASRMRAKLRTLGQSLHSGLVLVPRAQEEMVDKLDAVCAAAGSNFNAKARHHFVQCTMYKMPIASQDAKVARGLAFKLQSKMGEIAKALDECDVSKVRNLAGQMASFSNVLPSRASDAVSKEVGDRVEDFVTQARTAANWMKEELDKKGRKIEQVREEYNSTPVDSIRMEFLEYDTSDEAQAMRASVEALAFEELEVELGSNGPELVQVDSDTTNITKADLVLDFSALEADDEAN